MQTNIRFQGQIIPVQGEVIKDQLWIHVNGRTFVQPAPGFAGRKSRQKSGSQKQSDQVVAPMPGKITKILVKPLQPVNKGDAILVMEAMKMEYTLKAEVSGIVQEINCAITDQVTLGKILVQLKSEEK